MMSAQESTTQAKTPGKRWEWSLVACLPAHGGAAVGLSLRVAGAVHWTSRWQATWHHQSGCGLLFSAKEGATVLGWLSSDEPFLLYGLAPSLSRPQQGSHEPVANASPDLGRSTSLLTLCLSHASAP